MTPEQLAELKESIVEEVISKLSIVLDFEGDNYGNNGGHVSIYLKYDDHTISSDSVYVR
jgi:hypothetical protein